MTPVAGRTPVIVTATDGNVVLEITDRLDEDAGDALISAATSALTTKPERIDIDLRALSSWTERGAGALTRCREVCRELPGGLHYRTGRGPGREALLAAYS